MLYEYNQNALLPCFFCCIVIFVVPRRPLLSAVWNILKLYGIVWNCKLNRERNSGCLHHEYFIFYVHGCIAIIYHLWAAIKSDLRAVWEIFPFSRFSPAFRFSLFPVAFLGIFYRVFEWCWAEHGSCKLLGNFHFCWAFPALAFSILFFAWSHRNNT